MNQSDDTRRSSADLLIIEDSPSTLQHLEEILKNDGFSIRTETGVPSGLESVESSEPALILVEGSLQNRAEDATLQSLQEKLLNSDIPVVWVTSPGQQINKARAICLGANEFLSNPSDSFEVLTRVKMLLAFRETAAANIELENEKRELRKDVERWQNFFDNAIFGIVIYQLIRDEKGKIVDFLHLYVNPATAVHTGWDINEIKDKRALEIATPEEISKILELNTRAVETGEPWRMEQHFPFYDRTLDMATFYLGNDLIATTFNDISESVKAKQALQSEKEFTDAALNSQLDTFFLFDPAAGKAIRWNRTFSEVSGYSDKEILSLPAPASYYSPEDVARAADFIQSVLETGSGTIELELNCKNGRKVPTEYRVAVIRDDQGNPKYIISIGRDITEQKQAEAKRLELETQLHQSQKMEAIGLLAGGVAHDFNNILTAILGNVDLNMDQARKELGSDHGVVRGLEEIEDAVQRATSLTRQLLTFSRRDVIRPKILNLNQILNGLDSLFKRLIAANIQFKTISEPDLLSVHADSGQLEQVIVNLVVNAVQAMPDGGGLSLETRNVIIDENYLQRHVNIRKGPYVLMIVSDTGQGIEGDALERIFEPFFTTKSKDKGTGLGLATVHGIVEHAGGHITVYSEPGKGTTFKVYLPAIDERPQPYSPASGDDQDLTGTETILLCEDDTSVLELTAQSMRSAGYAVLTASNGSAGIQAAEMYHGNIDMLVTDVMMPGMNGRMVAEKLRTLQPELPVLFISGYTSNVIAHHGVLDEGIEFLEKPFTWKALLLRIRALLDESRSAAG